MVQRETQNEERTKDGARGSNMSDTAEEGDQNPKENPKPSPADGDYSHKIKRCLLLGRKAITKLDSILKSRDITLPTKVDIAKATVFPAAMYRHECWTIKKAEHQTIDAFKLWCWGRLHRVPWTAKKSNQSILREINPEYSLERLMAKKRAAEAEMVEWHH